MDLVERAGDLKAMLIEFALSPRFNRELSAVVEEHFRGGLITDESMFSMVLDHFALQYRLPSGSTVVEAFTQGFVKVCVTVRDWQVCVWRSADGGSGLFRQLLSVVALGRVHGLLATRGVRGTDVLDVRAQPVVMIRVPTLTDHHS